MWKCALDDILHWFCFSNLQVPDGFIQRFYGISEHTSPVLAWGFLGPDSPLKEMCFYFKVSWDIVINLYLNLDNLHSIVPKSIVQLQAREPSHTHFRVWVMLIRPYFHMFVRQTEFYYTLPPSNKLTTRNNWNIVESDIEHHNPIFLYIPNKITCLF